MKIIDIFETDIINDELVMVSLDNKVLNGILRANETAAFIISCLKEDTTIDGINQKMVDKYGIDYELADKCVNKVISQLRTLKLIVD